jgi:type IV pilus assembly protein PilY1
MKFSITHTTQTMPRRITGIGLFIAQAIIFCALVWSMPAAHAQLPAVPPNIQTDAGKPMVMLNMSRDHQLFYRAYNEYTDINFDGTPDTSYNHSIDYYGYFDPYKCYTYSGTASKFKPASVNTDKYCSSQWSGNFLNWATMTRIDVVRKVLYGGYRSTDSASSTVLERGNLPTDSHSFAKYYNGADLVKLTPFTAAQLAPRNVMLRGLGNWWEEANAGGNGFRMMSGITICNTTLGGDGVNRYSQSNTNPPLMRVSFGDFSLWNANERWQCYWEEERPGATNGNNPSITGLNASPRSPNRDEYWVNTNPGPVWNPYPGLGLTSGGSGPDLAVRIDACVPGLLGTERCATYPNGNSKPIGLLQEFGETNSAEFALITGSYAKNVSGGVLRKNMDSFRPEINRTTNGTFTGVDGIVKTLDRLRIYGYDYFDGTYGGDIDSSNAWCSYQLTGLVDNQCASWGNPLGEMFLESLRYLGGKTASSTFGYTNSGSKDQAMGLGQVAWIDPFKRSSAAARTAVESEFGAAQCRAINILNFNASVISYDKDNVGGLSDLTSTNLNNTLATITQGEGINGTLRLVGGNGNTNNRVCDAKTINSLADVEGLCPDAPAYKGSYNLAGLAYWAHSNRIRSDISTGVAKAFKADTYSVALSPGSPRIVVSAQGDASKKVIIQPAYRLDLGGSNVGGGTLVDFRIVQQTPTYGKYLIIWEDSEQGGDYDQDVSGTLEYFVNGNEIKVKTFVFAAATVNPQGFGYVISGTEGKDGVHYHSGILGFNYTDSTNISVASTNPARLNASGGCVSCEVNDLPTTATYTIKGGNNQALEDPLYYAAKWGGFKGAESSPAATPTTVDSWDSKKQDGSPGADGVPDNYFVVYRPDLLENALRKVFTQILAASNSAPSVSSAELSLGSLKIVTKFSPQDGRGQIDAFAIDSNGQFAPTSSFSGDIKLTQTPANDRQVFTNVGSAGVAFTYSNINALGTAGAAYLNQISTNATTATAIINYMRGDRSNEGTLGLRLRQRNADSIMGAVVNSTPWIQRPPAADYSGNQFPGFGAFANAQKGRRGIVWVGANDGMLHGFDSTNLDPVISYVPGLLSDRIKNTADPLQTGIEAYVDGSPFTAEVITSGTNWATYLFSSLGRGKPGMFALDVTNTGALNQTGASNIFKWQYPLAADADLGYQLARPFNSRITSEPMQVAKFRNGKFGVIFGNGVQSSSGKAALYILFVQGPGIDGEWTNDTDFVKLTVPGTLTSNGLSQIVWDSNGNDNIADEIYAGDLQGNLWKFDVSSSTPANWTVSYGKPLYVALDSAGNRLPITGSPITAAHPNGGRVVVVSTGKSIVSGDFPNTAATQRIFGIWDKPIFDTNTAQIPSGVSELLERPLVATSTETLATSGTVTAIDWTIHKGYYMDIPLSGGAVITNPGYVPSNPRNVFFGITFPKGGGLTCSDTLATNIAVFNPISGFLISSLTLNGQNPIATPNLIDYNTNTNNPPCTGPNCCNGPNCICKDGANCCPPGKICKDCKGNVTTFLTDNDSSSQCDDPTQSRIQWREIPGIFTGPRK